jgi:hypothetical protein
MLHPDIPDIPAMQMLFTSEAHGADSEADLLVNSRVYGAYNYSLAI